jgi:hypothetical protein
MPNRTTRFAPLSSTLLFHPLSFQGAQSYEVFRFGKLPTSFPGEERQSYRFFGTYKPLLSKTPFALTGAQRYKTFRFVKPLPLSSTYLLTGRQRYEVFDIHKCRPIPSLPYPSIKDHAKSHNQTLPCHHPPPLLPLLFFRERKVTKFFALSSHLTSPPRGYGKVTNFWAFASAPPLTTYPLSKTPMLLRGGNAKVRNFQLCQAPHPIAYAQRSIRAPRGGQSYEVFRFVKPPFSASLFVRERKGTKILYRQRFLLSAAPLAGSQRPYLFLSGGKSTEFLASSSPPLMLPFKDQ